eukprot:31205-Pelagococcus_subviridis.AAC.21
MSHEQRRQQRVFGYPLREAIGDARREQHVAVLDRRDVDEHHRGRVGLSSYSIGVSVLDRRARDVLRPRLPDAPRGKTKQNLSLVRLGEVELPGVELLTHLVHLELRRSLLRRAAFVVLRHEPDPPGDDLRVARGHVVPEQTRRESIFPRREEDPVERRDVLHVPALRAAAAAAAAAAARVAAAAVAAAASVVHAERRRARGREAAVVAEASVVRVRVHVHAPLRAVPYERTSGWS